MSGRWGQICLTLRWFAVVTNEGPLREGKADYLNETADKSEQRSEGSLLYDSLYMSV
jgi:hypothetical protein